MIVVLETRLIRSSIFTAGVLVTGIFSGTKVLQQFLSCKKTYECVALFGCSTDTYDAVGKIMCRAPHQHITREAVEEALNAFRGDIMQKPPMYVPSSMSINATFFLECTVGVYSGTRSRNSKLMISFRAVAILLSTTRENDSTNTLVKANHFP